MIYVIFGLVVVLLIAILVFVWKVHQRTLTDNEPASVSFNNLVRSSVQGAFEKEEEKQRSQFEGDLNGIQRMNWLEGVEGEIEGKNFHIGLRTVTLGRGIGNYVQVIDENVSRVHLRFVPTEEEVKIYDLGSSNGTFVNSLEVKEAILTDGDILQVGDARFQFYQRADFEKNHGFDPKTLNDHILNATTTNFEVDELAEVLKGVLQTVDNDYDKAANLLNMDIDMMKKALKRANNRVK